MNIWLINHFAIAPHSSGGTRHFNIAKQLVDRGHSVTIVAASVDYLSKRDDRLKPGERFKLESMDGVSFLWVKVPNLRGNIGRVFSMLIFSFFLPSVLRSAALENPDVVVGSSPHLFAAFRAFFLARKKGAKFVLEVRDLWPESFVDLGVLSKWHPLVLILGWIERFLYKKSAQIISLLPYAHVYIESRGAEKGKVTWIPNGVDMKGVDASRTFERGGVFTFMYAGSHGIPNELDFLLDVMRKLNAERNANDFCLRLVGDGPNKKSLMERVLKENISNVVFEDPVSKSEIYSVLSQADVFLLPIPDLPLYRWGYSPNKLSDFFAVGRPVVIACSARYNPVAEAGAGLSVASGDVAGVAAAMNSLLDMDPRLRAEMGKRGRSYVDKELSIGMLATRYEQVLKS